MWQLIDAILSGTSAGPLDDDPRVARAKWLRPQLGILAGVVSVGRIFAAIINSEWEVRIITGVMAAAMAIWAIGSVQAYRQRKRMGRSAGGSGTTPFEARSDKR